MMNSRIIMSGIVLVLLAAAGCASSKAERPAQQSARQAAEAPESAAKAAPAADQASADTASREESNPKGPIDLGMGDDEGDAEIVIDRPKGAADTEGALGEEAEDSKEYEQACETVADCADLESLDCPGEMQCVEQKCVYTCEDEADDEDADDEEADEDADEGFVHPREQ